MYMYRCGKLLVDGSGIIILYELVMKLSGSSTGQPIGQWVHLLAKNPDLLVNGSTTLWFASGL